MEPMKKLFYIHGYEDLPSEVNAILNNFTGEKCILNFSEPLVERLGIGHTVIDVRAGDIDDDQIGSIVNRAKELNDPADTDVPFFSFQTLILLPDTLLYRIDTRQNKLSKTLKNVLVWPENDVDFYHVVIEYFSRPVGKIILPPRLHGFPEAIHKCRQQKFLGRYMMAEFTVYETDPHGGGRGMLRMHSAQFSGSVEEVQIEYCPFCAQNLGVLDKEMLNQSQSGSR